MLREGPVPPVFNFDSGVAEGRLPNKARRTALTALVCDGVAASRACPDTGYSALTCCRALWYAAGDAADAEGQDVLPGSRGASA